MQLMRFILAISVVLCVVVSAAVSIGRSRTYPAATALGVQHTVAVDNHIDLFYGLVYPKRSPTGITPIRFEDETTYPSPDGRTVARISCLPMGFDYTCQLTIGTTGDYVSLPDEVRPFYTYRWSPDGDRFYFAPYTSSQSGDKLQVYDLTTQRVTTLGDAPIKRFTCMPQGHWCTVVYDADAGYSRYRLDLTTGDLRVIADEVNLFYHDQWLRQTPHLIFERQVGERSELVLYHPDADTARVLFDLSEGRIQQFWIQDRQEAWLAVRTDLHANELHLVSIHDDEAVPTAALQTAFQLEVNTWSPVEPAVLFTAQVAFGDVTNYYLAAPHMEAAIQLTDFDQRYRTTTAWSPDGKWIAITAFPESRFGRKSIYVVPSDGSRPPRQIRLPAAYNAGDIVWSSGG